MGVCCLTFGSGLKWPFEELQRLSHCMSASVFSCSNFKHKTFNPCCCVLRSSHNGQLCVFLCLLSHMPPPPPPRPALNYTAECFLLHPTSLHHCHLFILLLVLAMHSCTKACVSPLLSIHHPSIVSYIDPSSPSQLIHDPIEEQLQQHHRHQEYLYLSSDANTWLMKTDELSCVCSFSHTHTYSHLRASKFSHSPSISSHKVKYLSSNNTSAVVGEGGVCVCI